MNSIVADGDVCPCSTGRNYGMCCGPVHRTGAGLGIFAEQLMRARYSAYVIGDVDFLVRSWHPDTRPADLRPDPGLIWTGLSIVDTEAGTGLDTEGTVTFEAAFVGRDGPGVLRERSRFVRVAGQWAYFDGTVHGTVDGPVDRTG